MLANNKNKNNNNNNNNIGKFVYSSWWDGIARSV
jgi:hypothetical protein